MLTKEIFLVFTEKSIYKNNYLNNQILFVLHETLPKIFFQEGIKILLNDTRKSVMNICHA